MANKRQKKKKAVQAIKKEVKKQVKDTSRALNKLGGSRKNSGVMQLAKALDKAFYNPTTKSKTKVQNRVNKAIYNNVQAKPFKYNPREASEVLEYMDNAEKWAYVKEYEDLVNEGYLRSLHFETYEEKISYIYDRLTEEDWLAVLKKADEKRLDLLKKDEERREKMRKRRENFAKYGFAAEDM